MAIAMPVPKLQLQDTKLLQSLGSFRLVDLATCAIRRVFRLIRFIPDQGHRDSSYGMIAYSLNQSINQHLFIHQETVNAIIFSRQLRHLLTHQILLSINTLTTMLLAVIVQNTITWLEDGETTAEVNMSTATSPRLGFINIKKNIHSVTFDK